MCKLTEKYTKSKSFTGYKVVYKKDGKYYSPATGIEYKEDMDIPRIRKRRPLAASLGLFVDVFNKQRGVYEPLMKGKTALLCNHKEAIGVRDWNSDDFELSVVKMIISGDLHEGSYKTYVSDGFSTVVIPIIAGTHIDKIEEV